MSQKQRDSEHQKLVKIKKMFTLWINKIILLCYKIVGKNPSYSCGNCGVVLPDRYENSSIECPKCGSNKRKVTIKINPISLGEIKDYYKNHPREFIFVIIPLNLIVAIIGITLGGWFGGVVTLVLGLIITWKMAR